MDTEQLSHYFYLPINDAATELGMCNTALKKICRANGIKRWPHRKIKSVNGLITSVSQLLETKPEDATHLKEELLLLQEKRKYILKHPNESYKMIIPKKLVNSIGARILLGNEEGSLVPKLAAQSIKPIKTIKKVNNKRIRLVTSQENSVAIKLACLKYQTHEERNIVGQFMAGLVNLRAPSAITV